MTLTDIGNIPGGLRLDLPPVKIGGDGRPPVPFAIKYKWVLVVIGLILLWVVLR